VSRVVFLNSLFFPLGPTEEPANPFPTFPLTLNGKTTPFTGSDALWTPVTPDPQGTLCPGRIIQGTKDQVWNQTMEHETVGCAWGPIPWSAETPAGGLNRAPTFSGYGWNSEVARQLRDNIPTLVMQGLEDGAVPAGPGTGQAIYNALPESGFKKVLVKVKCASHAMVWEGCAEAGCTPPHATLKNALIGWIKDGKFTVGTVGHESGRFIVDERGTVTADTTT